MTGPVTFHSGQRVVLRSFCPECGVVDPPKCDHEDRLPEQEADVVTDGDEETYEDGAVVMVRTVQHDFDEDGLCELTLDQIKEVLP